jgi:hypothetical protein
MSLDEAIKHCEEKAKEIRWQALRERMDIEGVAECETCAEEHEQLAEWLRDYKRLLEEEKKREQEQAKMLDDMNKEYNNG